MDEPVIYEGFDEALWKAGVADGAFSGTRDPDARWFTLEAGGKKLALASAVPGPGELTSVSYFVVNEARGKGYATALASNVCDRFEKASFLVMKDNDASVKVALNALRDKFSMTLGHNVVRLTKTAAPDHKNTVGTTLEGKIHESFTVAADRIFQSGLLTTKERISLSGAIGDVLGSFRKKIAPDVYKKPMSDRAHELLKNAVSQRLSAVVRNARMMAQPGSPYLKATSSQARNRRIESAARGVMKMSPAQMTTGQRQVEKQVIRGTQKIFPARDPVLVAEISRKIRAKIDPQERLL